MPPPELPLEVLQMIAPLVTDNAGEFGFADFNSFVQVNRVLHASLNRTLWQKAAQSDWARERVFYHLIRTNNLALLKRFLELGADVDTLLPRFHDRHEYNYSSSLTLPPTALKVAVELDNVPMARILLQHGADIVQYNLANRVTHTALHAARSADMVHLLWDYHADIEQKTVKGYRPLHYFAMRSNIDAMRAVLRYGAKVSPIGGLRAFTPLHVAARINQEAVKVLLQHGANANKGNLYLRTPLHNAARFGTCEAVALLVERCPQAMKEKDCDGATPLHLAAAAGKTDTVRILLERWPEGTREKDVYQKTPLDYAVMIRNTEMVRLLKEGATKAKEALNVTEETPL
jgi:ankyrin repeat protein